MSGVRVPEPPVCKVYTVKGLQRIDFRVSFLKNTRKPNMLGLALGLRHAETQKSTAENL